MQPTFLRLKRLRWFEWLHHLYVVGAIAGWYVSLIAGDTNSQQLALTILLGVYFIVLFVFVFFWTYVQGYKARYAEASRNLHQAHHSIRDAFHYLDWCLSPERGDCQFSKQAFENYMTGCLTAAASAFSLISGTACRTSLKVIGQKDDKDGGLSEAERLYVQTLARDAVSSPASREQDRDEGEKHSVMQNTDFRFILQRKIRFYFEGNLPGCQNYENTSLPRGFAERGKGKGETWPLCYKSTIVWPIRYVYEAHEREQVKGRRDQDLYGYLTVDSSARNVFNERYDVEVGAALADALFPVLDAYRKVRERQRNEAVKATDQSGHCIAEKRGASHA